MATPDFGANLLDMFFAAAARGGDRPFLWAKREGAYRPWPWRRVADEVRALATSLLVAGDRVVIGYADCGTYGALDEVCRRRGWPRLAGLHCYDVYAHPAAVARLFEEEAGTYLLTDFLVRSFDRTVLAELGLDRHPELRDDYFGAYTRVVWLAQEPDDELHGLAVEAAAAIGLPLTVVDTGHTGLEAALEALVRPGG